MSRTTKVAIALVAGVLIVGGGFYYLIRVSLPRFHAVREGVLYRSGQPRGIGLEWLKARDIRTLINLRKPESDGTPEERRFARENGLRFYNFSIGNTPTAIQASVDTFLDIVDDESSWPVLVHCAAGKERAAVMSAVFRLEYDGWSNGEALEEAYRLGLEKGAMPIREEFIRNYRRRAGK